MQPNRRPCNVLTIRNQMQTIFVSFIIFNTILLWHYLCLPYNYFNCLSPEYDMDEIPTYEEVELFQPGAGRFRPVVLIGKCCRSIPSSGLNRLALDNTICFMHCGLIPSNSFNRIASQYNICISCMHYGSIAPSMYHHRNT